jgi:acetyl esterase/lipase
MGACTALAALPVGPAAAAPPDPEYPVTVTRDIAYAPPGDRAHLLDLYVPQGVRGRIPIIVYIHGGGWLGGDKADGPDFVEHYANDGFAVASINYRTARQAIMPAQLIDVQDAIRWLRANANAYGLDGRRIGLWGSSAGGHLAALAGTAGGEHEPAGALTGSADVQAVVDWKGPTDLLQLDEFRHPESRIPYEQPGAPENRLVGCAQVLSACKAAADAANPITYISRDDPPFLIMHGDDDRTVPYQQSVIFYDALAAACHRAKLYLLHGIDHGSALDRALEAQPPVEVTVSRTRGCRSEVDSGPPATWETVERFFKRQLNKPRAHGAGQR